MTPSLRPLQWTDLEWLRDLRNASRRVFFQSDEITPEQQLVWWTMQRPDEEHWVICDGERRIGYFAFVRPNPVLPVFSTAPLKGHIRYLNSLLLEQPYRGQGIMPLAIRAKMRDAISYCGYVKENNVASLSTCLKTGMKRMGIYECDGYGRLHVLWKG